MDSPGENLAAAVPVTGTERNIVPHVMEKVKPNGGFSFIR